MILSNNRGTKLASLSSVVSNTPRFPNTVSVKKSVIEGVMTSKRDHSYWNLANFFLKAINAR